MAPSTPLRYPSGYFQRHDRPSLSIAAGVILTEAILISITVWLFLQQVMAQVNVSPAERASVNHAISGGIIGVFIGIFFGWLLFAAIFHVFVWFASGDRGFGTTLAVVGEADLVSIVLFPIAAAGLFMMVSEIPSNPAAAAEFLEQTGPYTSPLSLLASFVGFIWKAAVQGIGLAEAHGISVSKMLTLALVLGVLGFFSNLV